jgi:hypothetical protein
MQCYLIVVRKFNYIFIIYILFTTTISKIYSNLSYKAKHRNNLN